MHSETGAASEARWAMGGFLRLPDSAEQLDLLLLTVAKPRRVHPDEIHFQGYRYLDTTLAAYVGWDVIIRSDPRKLAELRVYFGDVSRCRAICPDWRPGPGAGCAPRTQRGGIGDRQRHVSRCNPLLQKP
ncbi:MAG: Mu transposase C-terminal domain-containing protein [Chloroflexi bacterium]|nr:Mu transposase C-terminal domain-containing protein [Chloroflexota bacterium]